MSELQISNVSAYRRKQSFHPVSYNAVVSDHSLLYSAEPAWGTPPAHNPPTAELPPQAVLKPCPPPTLLSPRALPPTQGTCPHGRTRGSRATQQGITEVQAVAWEAGRGFDGRGGSSTHVPQEGGRLPCTIQLRGFPAQEQFLGLSLSKKKSQVLGDAGTASPRQQLRSGIAFLDFCACNSLAALSRVTQLGVSFAFTQLHPLSNSGSSFQVNLRFVSRVLGQRSMNRGKREPLSQGDTAAHRLLLLNTGVQPGRINLQDHKLCTLQLGV